MKKIALALIGLLMPSLTGAAVRVYRADTVTDLNGEGQGGVQALAIFGAITGRDPRSLGDTFTPAAPRRCVAGR